ncbi:MAG TPA: ABC transporter ATP-binding protein [Gemmatimonadaceae bacterium]|nr:ABC transporter ATP-binding protein [Gemmatimonadaceae bacterium]
MQQPFDRRRGRSLARRSFEFIAGHRAAVTGIVALALVLAVLGAADPLVMKTLFDALGRRDTRVLPAAVGALLGIEVARALLGGWLSVLTWRVKLGVDLNMRDRLLGKLLALPLDYHAEQGVGGTMNKINTSVTAFVAAFAEIAFNVLPTVVYLAISVFAMWRMNWRLAVTVLVFTPLPALIGAYAAPEQTTRERRLMEHWTRVYARLSEVLSGIKVVQIFAMEKLEHRQFIAEQKRGTEIVAHGVRTDTVTTAAQAFAATLARIAAIAMGAWLIIRGDITLGSLVAFLGYVTGLFGPVQGLTNVYQTIRKAAVAVETTYEILDADECVADLPDAITVDHLAGDIAFHDVTFSHADGATLFEGLELRVKPGETVALVGPSGSGKSTITSLLLRLHALERGAITIDGYDIRQLQAASLRRQVGYVGQEIHLFNDTVRANIAFGSPDATPEDVEVAARCANAHEFIMSLPEGYDTIVGERGSRLSGGQRQRIAIARAMLKNAPILILDEATSALDTVSEAAVQQALDQLRRNRTTIMIAHRLSTVVNADRIVVIRDGAVVDEGTHEELIARSPYYRSLHGSRQHDESFDVPRLADVA